MRRFLVNDLVVGAAGDANLHRAPCVDAAGTLLGTEPPEKERTKPPWDCSPNTALALPIDAPGTLEALALLHADLNRTLGEVEARHVQVKAALELTTRADLEAAKTHLEGALADVQTRLDNFRP